MTNQSTSSLDTAMITVIENMARVMTEITNQSVNEILKIATKFMDDTSRKALEDFHKLYFSGDDLSAKKDDINSDVDLLFEAIQKTLAEGGDTDNIQESEEDKTVRLGLAALQKQLESIVQLDLGMREKLVPAIMSMQFEDATRQRLAHLVEVWKTAATHSGESVATIQNAVHEKANAIFSSAVERGLYFPIVLQEPPPVHLSNNENWLMNLL